MPPYAFELWDVPALTIAGSEAQFPVRHIYCVGRNYAEHVKEMGGDAAKEPPCFFTKAADSVVPGGGGVRYPLGTRNLHHEIELVLAIGAEGESLSSSKAMDLVFGYAIGIDFTRRDLQNAAKEARQPWDLGKSFAQAAPIGAIHPVSAVGQVNRGGIWLEVNGQRRQDGRLEDMIWSLPEVIALLSKYYRLLPGDLIFTGTPSGVGPVVPGDRLRGGIDGLGLLEVEILPR
ncbi:fumarylpyruvate hydrolase [Burkholderiales bacterium]|nr:MAG: fumarylacetoacetate hydrolase family protein [Burkholderiales bacterium]CAG0995238.1 fumarylpyruvate hydrolase [Burkholderiales bacterium]